MGTCKKIANFIFCLSIIFIFTNLAHGTNFKKLENKKVSYLDFFLLKFENKISKRSHVLRRQFFASRVQYSSVGIQLDFDKKREEIFVNIYAIMDRNRYKKKRYEQKLSDCNQVRNLIFYNKHGYKFFTQKRDPSLSEGLMEDTFKRIFFDNIDFNDEEINFLLDKMYVRVTILHPIKKKELTCGGKINQYELE